MAFFARGIVIMGWCMGLAGAAAAEPDWPFVPPATGAGGGELSLRDLNEKVAGQSGFVRRSPDGEGFILGDGTPVRFWAVNTGVRKFTDAELDAHAAWLARMGVNMARISGSTIQSKAPGSKVTDVDDQSLDDIWRAAAAMKKQGIYLTLHHYWGKGSGADVTNWGLDGYTGKDEIWGLLFFNKELQRGYRAWLKELYARPNPHTGIPLARDPVVGLILLQNEDSLLFHTVSKIKPPQQAILAAQFAEWLKAKYGSLDGAFKAWGAGAILPGDRPEDGVLALYPIHEAAQPQSGGKARRITDQYRFYVETMRRFNAETARYLREELGCGSLICAENWRTASDALMLDAERYAYTVNDVIAKNHYFSGHFQGLAGGGIGKGNHFTNASALTSPWASPLNMKHAAGHPSVITESSWTNPNLYQSEGPFLAAVYGSLTGLNGFYWFAVGGATEYDTAYKKFVVGQPMLAGMFPATARLYRMGYVRRGETVVHEARPLDDLWERKPPLIQDDHSRDPNRSDEGPSEGRGGTRVNPLAFLTGRVEAAYGVDAARTRVADVGQWIDADKKIVRSSTGEIELNYGIGVCAVNAPKAQGACGFLNKAGRIALADVEIESRDAYATVLLVSLDDAPIARSRKVLAQVGTTTRPTGWRTEPGAFRPRRATEDVGGEKILEVGQAPWRIVNTQTRLRIRNAGLIRGNLLDAAGAPVREVSIVSKDGEVSLDLPPDSMYLVLYAP